QAALSRDRSGQAEIDREQNADRGERKGEKGGEPRQRDVRHVFGWQRAHVPVMIEQGTENNAHAHQYEHDADHGRCKMAMLWCARRLRRAMQQGQEQTEARHDEAESHEGKARAHPSEQRALGGEEYTRITHGPIYFFSRWRNFCRNLLTFGATTAMQYG